MNPNYFSDKLASLESGVEKRSDILKTFDEKLAGLQILEQQQQEFKDQNSGSLVSSLGLTPGTTAANVVNMGASLLSDAARTAGYIGSLPYNVAASHAESQLRPEHYDAYRRMREGTATDRDRLILSSSTYMDDRENNPTIQQSIEEGRRLRRAGTGIGENMRIVDDLVHKGNRQGLMEDLTDDFESLWGQTKEGWSQLGEGQDKEGWTNLVKGVGGLIANAGSAVMDNPMGAAEYVIGNVPQLALGAFGKVGMGLLSTSNVGYAVDEFNKGLQKYQQENNGAMPSAEQKERMATYAMSLALAEQLGDVSLLKGIGRIAGTTDEAVQAGFKQALKGYAGAVAKGGLTETLTEGYQTFAEGEANLEGSTAKDIYVGATIGGVAGGGMTAAAPLLAVAGKTKDGIQGYKRARQEAAKDLERQAANDEMLAQARETGNVDVFLNRKDRANYDPSKAMEVLFAQDTSAFTEEQQQAHASKIQQVINSFERDVAVLRSSMQRGDSPELQAELAELQQEAQDYPDDPTIAEDIALLQSKMQEPPLSAQERQAYEAQLKAIEPKLEKARQIYEQTVNVKIGTLEQSTNVQDAIQAIQSAADPTAVSGEVQKIRILSMASPGSVTVQQAQALLNSGKLSDADSRYFRLYINAEQSAKNVKDINQVGVEVTQGNDALQQKGLATYRKRFAAFMADGNVYLARREMNGLVKFTDSHTAKLDAMNAALQASRQTGRDYHIFKDAQGVWQSQAIPEGTKNFKRKKGEYVIGAKGSEPLVQRVENEVQAMGDTLALLQSQLESPATNTNPVTPGVADEGSRVTNPTAVSDDAVSVPSTTPEAPGGSQGSVENAGIGQTQAVAPAPEAGQSGSGTVTEPVVSDESGTSTEVNTATEGATDTSEETAAAAEVAEEVAEASSEGVDADADVSTEGSTEQSVEQETAGLSVFTSDNPATALIREGLTQRAGREGGTQRPLVKVKDFLSSLVSGTVSVTDFLKDPLTVEQQQTLRKFLQVAPKWNATIQKILPPVKDFKEAFFWKNPAEFLMTNADGQVDLDENVKTAISAAAMAWVSDFYRQGLFNNDKAINLLLGRDDNHEVTDTERDALAYAGVRRATAANALGRRVVEALGLKAKKNAPKNLMVNLEASLGAYAMQLLMTEGVLEREGSLTQERWVELTGVSGDPTYERASQEFVRLARNPSNVKEITEKVRWVIEANKGSQNLMEKLFSVQDGASFPTMQPVDYQQQRVQKGMTRVPKKLAEVLQKKNQEPNFLRTTMYEIMSAVSPELFLQMAGVMEVSDDTMHINRRRSQEAKNEGLERDYWNIREFIESTWSAAGLELPIFLQHVAWKNQRVGIENTVLNPQTSKIARHLLTRETWRSTVDKDSPSSFENFKLRVLEGFGTKTDKQSNAKALQEWQTLMDRPVIQAGVNVLVFMRNNRGSELSAEQQQAIVDAVKLGGENMKTLDALNALADLQMAEGSTFVTELVGEVDGVTNGPMLTNLLMGASDVASQLFGLINMGGFFQQGAGFENYNVYRGSGGVMDLYESTTKMVLDAIRPKAKSPAFEAIWAFTGAMEDKDNKAGRNIIKRPITALYFGSALNKAVDGMADDFVEAVYKQIEKYHTEGRDVTPLVKHLNRMLKLSGNRAIPENITSEALMNLEFKPEQVKRLKEHFHEQMGKPTMKVLKTRFTSVMSRKRSVNGTAGLLFGMYNTVYQAMRTEYLNELVKAGVMETDAAGKPKWDLSQEQEAELDRRLKKLRPILGTALSTASGELASGLSISKTEQRLSGDALHQSRVQFNKSAVGQASMMVSGQTMVETGPGVAPFSVSIHSFDSAVSHFAALLSEALNIHDAHVTGLGNFQQVAQSLNKALWDMALQYSPAQAMYESAERQVKAMHKVLADPKTSNEVRGSLKMYLEEAIKAHNAKQGENGPVFVGSPIDFLIFQLQEAKSEAYLADQVRLGALSEMAFVDQYALEGGQYTVTEADRQAAKTALENLKPAVPGNILEMVRSLETLLESSAEPDTTVQVQEDLYPGEQQGVQKTLEASDAEVAGLLEAATRSNTTPEHVKPVLESAQALMENTGTTLDKALEVNGNTTQERVVATQYLGTLQQSAQSTPFGVLGAPAVVPEGDVVALMEANPEMSGKEAVKKLWSVLQQRGDFPQKAFYSKLLQMTAKVLGDDIRVKYVTTQTAPDEVLASPAQASRGWYVANNGTIYILSPEFAASGLTAEVLVHELVHAAIEQLIESPSNARQKQAVQELASLLDKAKEYVQANNLTQFNDAVSHVQELVAWGMSNADFQHDVLNKITVPETTQSSRVVKGLKRFITSLVKLMFPDMAKPESGLVNGFAALVGNTTALYSEAGKQQAKKLSRAAEETNRLYSMASPTPNPQQIQHYTTEQVFDALGSMSPGLSQDFVLRLQERLQEVVNAFHGSFGAVKTEIEQRVGSTALDAWSNAVARGERPFVGKVLNAKLNFTVQETYVAEQVEAVMGELLQDKSAANSMIYKELEKVYLQAREHLKGQIDPDLYSFVFRPQKSLGNRSDYMARFVSLALAHEGFAKSLEFATRRPSLNFQGKTFMQRLEMLWRATVDWLSARMTNTFVGQQAGARTEALVRKLVQIEARHKDQIASRHSLLEFMDPAMDKVRDAVDGVRESVVNAAQSNFVRQNRLLVVQTAGKLVTASMRANKVAQGINAFRNKSIKGKHGEAMQLLNYVKGPGQWLNAMARVATRIQGERKHLMSDVSQAVLSGFENNGEYLKTEHKKSISAYLLRTGAFYLLDKFNASGIQTLLEDKKALDQAIQDEIGLLSGFPEVHYYIKQAKGLAWKQVTGWAGVEEQNLNAHNIARLYNTGNPSPAHAKDAQPAIERLIALYGLQYAKQEHPLGVDDLLVVMRTENARGADSGIEMTLRMHKYLTEDAKNRIFKESEALMMHGYLPEVTNPHTTFEVVRDAQEEQDLMDRGYVYEMDIPADPHDPDQRPAKMYVLKGGGLPRWASGAFSTTGTNAKGKTKHGQYFNSLDPSGVANMQSMSSIDAQKQKEVQKQFLPDPRFQPVRDQNRLVPLLNAQGQKVDYRYMMKEEFRDTLLERNNDFDHLLGVMAAGTYDKEASAEQNRELVKALYGFYRKDFASNPQNFVLVGQDSTDPDLKEIWDLLPSTTQRDIQAQWGIKGMMVPKEMITPLFGYRKATLSSLFDKENRNAVEQGFVGVATMLTRMVGRAKGMNQAAADQYAKQTAQKVRKVEDIWEEVVREMKDTIVVKTAFVLWGNMTSNFSVLLMNGLSLKEVVMYQKEALNAVMDYQRDRDALSQLQWQLNTAYGSVNADELIAEITRLQDALDRNPAKELIDAGLLPTIVEDVSMEDDPYSYKSQFSHWIDNKVKKLNPSVVNAGRVLYMTHDTTLYKFLNKSTQYSDFVGRYALYKHETTRKRNPLTKEQALFNASESFVNYDIPMPRLLQYLDDHGLMMFTKYFLSIQRVIVRLLTDKPLEVVNTIALNNWLFDLPILTDTAALVRVGNNPLSTGALGYPGTLDDLATINTAMGLMK